jgi:LacI family transcriptional regulator
MNQKTSETLRPVTLQDVAKAANVSTMTVSRVVRGQAKRVTPETTQHVKAVIEKLGYQPDIVAKSLRGDSTKTIGLMLSDFGGYFFSSCARAIDDFARQSGYSVMLAGSHEDIAAEESQFEMFMMRRIEGMLIVPTTGNHSFLKTANRRNIPIVALDREIEDLSIDTVVVENKNGSKNAVNHLLDHGHRRIACIGGEARLYTVAKRIEGYQAAMAERGFEPMVYEGTTNEAVASCVAKAVSGRKPATAIFAVNNVASLAVVQALASLKLTAGTDIALIGFDDFQAARSLSPGLTVIRQPASEVGRTAAGLLLERMENPGPSKRKKIVLPTELIIRESCGCKQH